MKKVNLFTYQPINCSKSCGFTLAEVLITLGVIGIVAALTIPILTNAYQEHEAVARVKETYSLVSQAVKQWEVEIGCIGQISKCMDAMPWGWGEDPSTQENGMEMRLAWTKYLKVSAHRGRYDGIPDWLDYDSYNIDGTLSTGIPNSTYGGVNKRNQAHRQFQYLLQNGVILSITGADGNFMWMDINGKKPPNRVAKDQFPIGFDHWTTYSLTPYLTYDTGDGGPVIGLCHQNRPDPCNPDDGRSPTAYVLVHSKLPDLEAMGYPK